MSAIQGKANLDIENLRGLNLMAVKRTEIQVEIAPGVPELCWNTHTHIHTSIYIYI
jgi:hypothetical protein